MAAITPRYWFIAACSILGTLVLVSGRQSATHCLEWGTRLVDPASGPMDPAVPEEVDVCLNEVASGRFPAPLNSDYMPWFLAALALVAFVWWRWEVARSDAAIQARMSQE
ncbi:MAG: hypothetical protein U0237_20125 [Thermoleophilia bacterium]